MNPNDGLKDFLTTRRAKVSPEHTGRRGGPEPDAVTLETFSRDIPET